ncbi:MAG: 1,4-dihydroxy-2-naphthoate polyprenyltransferase [Armatimonadota bacterium]|nr:1,4-dihydroxy-2-naphthoate polyprenyltransferase [Armatimonadota bacterium]
MIRDADRERRSVDASRPARGTHPPGPSKATPSAVFAWVTATRPATLTAAVAPVVVGSATAAAEQAFHPLAALAALAVGVFIQIGTNLANDAYDFLHGADTAERAGPVRVTAAGWLSARQVLAGAYLCFGAAACVGLYLVALRGWPLLIVGALAIVSGVAYTTGPLPIAYRGLGELFVFVFFGLVAVSGTDYVQTGAVRPQALSASVPVGLLCAAILVVNNLRDIDTDRAAAKRTLAVRIGRSWTRIEYTVCLVGAFAAPALMRAAGTLGAWFWLPWVALPFGLGLALRVWRDDGPRLNGALRGTARLHLLFAALLAAAILGPDR